MLIQSIHFWLSALEMVAALQNIEDSSDSSIVDGHSPKVPAREVRLLVEKQFSRLEAMENAFALAVEKFGELFIGSNDQMNNPSG
jgi:hypothetical protein